SVAPPIRHKAWKEKRVVFLTPHVMINDLCRGTCLADSIKCIVVDEAHKALRNYAYCQ
ncbi:FANCM protein, partial [Biomphalaria glabrata]